MLFCECHLCFRQGYIYPHQQDGLKIKRRKIGRHILFSTNIRTVFKTLHSSYKIVSSYHPNLLPELSILV